MSADTKKGDTPLMYILKRSDCSFETVKLLLEYNADINLLKDKEGTPPLIIALLYYREDVVVKALVDKGADVKAQDQVRHSSVCIALRHGFSIGIIKQLIDAGCSLNACGQHDSFLDCAAELPILGIVEGVIELFINSGGDLHRVNRRGESAICVALQGGARARDIELLVKKGASLNACIAHTSMLHCALVAFVGVPLKEDVVRFLLSAGACTNTANIKGHTPLQSALLVCNYEVNAIKLLLNASGANVNAQDTTNNTLLHLAVRNPNCKLSLVKYLIERGAQLDKVNDSKETPLHFAVNQACGAHIVNLLMQHGSRINEENEMGETPLQSAVYNQRGPNGALVLQLLLNAGVEKCHLYSSLVCALEWYDYTTDPKDLARFIILLKYYILENGKLGIHYMIDRRLDYMDYNTLLNMVNECVEEVYEMGLKNIGYGYTLHNFISRPFLPQLPPRDKNPALTYQNLNPLLRVLSNNSFPLFFEVISARIGRAWLKTCLRAVQVHTLKVNPYSLNIENQSFLDYNSVYGIAEYLPRADILRLILAFYILDD